MATFYRCDRCHAETSTASAMVQLQIPYDFRGLESMKHYHICDRCVNAVHDLLKPQEKPALKG